MSNELGPADASGANRSAIVNDTGSHEVGVHAPGTGKGQKGWVLASCVAFALIILGGVLQGSLSNRWGVSENVKEIGGRLRTLPMTLGSWTAIREEEIEPATLQLLECEGYIDRMYVNQATGESIRVNVFFGPKGPIAVHTPEVCYSARAVVPTSERAAKSNDYDGLPNEVWRLGFVGTGIEKEKLSVAYAWSDGGPWAAAKNPRFWRTDYLYKIQTATPTIGNKQDTTDEFFKVFLPELRQVMRTNG